MKHKVKITGVIVDDYDFGLSIQTPTHEYIKVGEEFKEYEGYDVKVTLKHWTYKD